MSAIVLIVSIFSSFFGSIDLPIFKERIQDKIGQLEPCAQTGCQR